VERIGGEHVEVNVMVQPGDEPATYEPKPEQLIALSKTAAHFSLGVPFESTWLSRIASANPKMMIVNTANDIERMPIAPGDQGGQAGGEGEPVNPDPHIWLSPTLVKVQAQTIYEALVKLDPDREADYQANLSRFIADIDTLDADIRATLAPVKNRRFIVFHPAWGYFARDYDLEMIPIELGGQEPSAAELARLVARAKEEDIHVIFASPQFSTRSAETIANEIDGKVLLIDPLAFDWLDNLRGIAATFAEVLDQ
jgi:zinc transport system substrate-binding protein